MTENSKNFDFSVIVPIYNVEEYLEETILSVINQTYSFKEHIQIILVNDGSPDNSEEICLKYQQLYPDNIIYVKQANGGVSAARNNGLEYAQGKYINFLDSDDTWEPNAFEKIHNFILDNPDIEVLCCKIKHFEGANYLHPLSKKLRDTRIVDINLEENYHYPHLQVSSSFIKNNYAKSIRFNNNLIIGEDALYLNKLILRAGRYASMPEVQYNYRTRLSQSSAIQTKENNIRFYHETVKGYYGGMIKASIDEYDSVIPYMQSILVYDIGWRMSRKSLMFLPRSNLTITAMSFQKFFHTLMIVLYSPTLFTGPSSKSLQCSDSNIKRISFTVNSATMRNSIHYAAAILQ